MEWYNNDTGHIMEHDTDVQIVEHDTDVQIVEHDTDVQIMEHDTDVEIVALDTDVQIMTQDTDVSHIATSCTAKDQPYVILKWNIENFSYVRDTLRSPCFDLGPTSKWNFVLEPRCDPGPGDDGEECVKISLRRSPECSSSKEIMINGEFTVHGPESNLLFDRTFKNVVLSENRLDFRMPRMLFLLPEGQSSPKSASLQSPSSSLQTLTIHKTYMIRCEMVISCETTTNSAGKPDWKLHLEKLSSDMENLLLGSQDRFTDMRIRVRENDIYAHKAILHARSKAISGILKVSNAVVETDDVGEHVRAVLKFAYTGNPDFILRIVEVENFGQIAQIAKRWHLVELQNILTPFSMLCVSRMRNESYLHTWRIKNVIEQLFTAEHTTQITSEFSTNHVHQVQGRNFTPNTKWKLILKRLLDSLELYLEKSDVNSGDVFWRIDVEFRVFNDKSNVDVRQSREDAFGQRNRRQRCRFTDMCTSTFLTNRIMKDDTLNVECKMEFYLDPEESCIPNTAECVDLTETEDSYPLKTLSCNLKNLYESKAYADLEVRSNRKIYDVHKAITWARSQYFRELLASTSPEYISLPIDDDFLNDILSYMYSAELPQLSLLNVQRLYEASFLLKLQELRLACRSYILKNLRIYNVLEITILALKCKDNDLEFAAEKFLCDPANAKIIITTPAWLNFRSKYPEFAIRIYHKLCTIFLGL